MTASPLMVVGTGSGVGKSSLVAGLGRLLRRRGYDVAPFKAQNMSNNSHIAREGGEMAVSQFMQARACGVEPSVHMNPILLKPNGDGESEVVVEGDPEGVMEWSEYRGRFEEMYRTVRASYDRVAKTADTVLLEGAGSPAEPNMMENDLVNLSLAEDLGADVILVGDISQGGVFAWLVGTLDLLEPAQRRLVSGVVINKFRGDKSVLDEAIEDLEERTGVPVLGVLPHSDAARLPAEDSRDLSNLRSSARTTNGLEIGLVKFPRLSNFTDFEMLANHPRVNFRIVEPDDRPSDPDAIVLPGTKNTLRDLRWLKRTGLSDWLRDQRDAGVEMLGVCGGYQMMGRRVADPEELESELGAEEGLGWFDFEVRYRAPKLTRRVSGSLVTSETTVEGYEVRYGRFVDPAAAPWARNGDRVLARSRDNLLGTPVHGLLQDRDVLNTYLKRLDDSFDGGVEASASVYDDWADVVGDHLDLGAVLNRINRERSQAKVAEAP